MTENKVGFKDYMYVFAAEDSEYETELKVLLPEVFLDKRTTSAVESKLYKSNNIFINANPPRVSHVVESKNYMILPIMNGETFGVVNAGERFIALFINSNPNNGIILGEKLRIKPIWDDVQDKLEKYPPEDHEHDISDISGDISVDWSNITNKPDFD